MAAQFVQKGEASAAEYVPAAQLSHAALPVVALYVPAAQAVQLFAGPVYPASHLHAEFEELLVSWSLAGTQCRYSRSSAQSTQNTCPQHRLCMLRSPHASEPRIVLYAPLAQRVHGGDPVEVAVKPTLHWHASAPVLDQVSLAQVRHGAEPGIALYFPAAQAPHVEVPV